MIKNVLAFSLMLGIFSFNCIGQTPIKFTTVKTVAGLSKQQSSQNLPAPPANSYQSFNGAKCGSGIIHNYLMANDANYNAQYQQIQKDIQKTIAGWKSGAKQLPPIYTVPVVFHVIHKGEAVGSGTNISDAQLQSAIPALNRDYRRTNADGGISLGNGPDTEIQFCLATKDPSGNTTTGINRVNGTSVSGYSANGITSSNEAQVKALSKWPNDQYVNIWVVSEIENNGADLANPSNWGGGVIGYAYGPSSPVTFNSAKDGIVIINISVGNDPNQTLGYRLWPWTLTNKDVSHEMGHVMNLLHPFDDNNPSVCSDGDGLADTPPAVQANLSSCTNPQSQGACPNQNINIYMDYVPEQCANMFSADETSVMRACLANVRNALTTSSNTNCTTCPTITVTATSTNPSCTSNNGSITASSSGGATPYTYLWSNSATTATINNLAAGTYTVTATDANGCTGTKSVTLTAPAGVPTVTTSTVSTTTQTSCDGSATASVSGGSSPFTYQWSTNANSQTTATATGLCAGTYTVTVTGSNSCTGTSTATVTGPPPPGCDSLFYYNGKYYTTKPIDTAGFVFSAKDNDQKTPDSSLIAYGITTQWQLYYEIVSPGDTNWYIGATSWFNPPGQADNWLMFGGVTIPSTGAELDWKYKIGDNNYRDGYQVLIDTTGATIANFTGATVLKNVPDNDASTNGDTVWTNNSVQITAPYVGKKVNIAFHHNANNQFLIFFDDITIKDCNANPNCTGFTVSATSTNPSCTQSNGSATATVTGGTTPYTYSWSNGGTTATITGLTAGTYTVTVSGGGCSSTKSVTLTSSGAPTVTATSTNPSCTQSNGSATANATGGTTPYTYSWSNGGTTATITGLAAGTYTVTVSGGGCSSTKSVTLASSGAPTVTATSTNPSCTQSNGSATASATGGTTPYTYSWSNGGTTATISGLAAGTYSVSVTGGGCTGTSSVTLTASGGPTVTTTSTNPTCGSNTGSATASATGGTTPYTYSWSNGGTTATISGLAAGTYTVTVTGGGCSGTSSVTLTSSGAPTVTVTSTNPSCTQSNGSATASATGGTTPYTYSWSNGGTTATITGLAAGTYTVTVTGGGCTGTSSVTLTSSGGPTVSATSTNATCGNSNGSATASATGGTTPYSYSWSNGGNTATVTGLSAGTYTVTVTGGGCTGTQSVTVTSSGTAPSVSATSTNAGCGTNSGTATVNATGGTTPYTYSWSNGGTTATISGLGAGVYTVTVTGGNCTATTSATVSGGGNMTATVSSTNSSCPNTCTGSASVAPSGGTTPYSYLWSNGGTTATKTNLCAGQYTVTVTDAAGCMVIKQINISSTSSTMFVSSSSANATCGNANGSGTVTASGGTTPYTYLWNSTPPQTSATASGLAAGNYNAVVTDNNGCKDTISVTVNNVGGVTANVTGNQTICAGAPPVVLTASGGSTYLWSTGATTNKDTVSPTATTTYIVTVTDNFQCSDTASTTVTVDSIPVTTVSASDDTVCKGDPVVLTASGGTSYFWNTVGQAGATITVNPNNNTSYTVIAYNGNCPGNQASITIDVILPAPNAVAGSDVTTTYISQGGTVNFNSTGSVGTSFGWDFTGDGTIDATTANASHSYSAAATYTVVLHVTLGGCTDTDTLIIDVQNQPNGVNEYSDETGIAIFPNPSNGTFTLSVAGEKAKPASVTIFNVLGEVVYKTTVTGRQSSVIDLSDKATGLYYVNITSGENTITRKVTLMKE